MDVSVSVSLFQDELASTIEHAVKAAVDTVLCEITKVVGGKFTEFRMEMAGKEKENESLKLRLEISESELKAVRECLSAAGANIKQALMNMNPDCNEQDFQRNENQGLLTRVQDPEETHAFSEEEEGPVIEAVYTHEEICEQEWCVSLMEITKLTFVDSKDPELDPVHIKEGVPELECDHITEEVSKEKKVNVLEGNIVKLETSHCDECIAELSCVKPNQSDSEDTGSSVGEEGTVLGSIQGKHHPPQERAADGKEEGAMPSTSSSASSSVDEREHDSTPSPHCKNSSSGNPQSKKHREMTQEEHIKKLRTCSVKIHSLQDRPPLTLQTTEAAHSVRVNNSETRGNLKTLPCSAKAKAGKSSRQLDSPKTHKRNHTGRAPFPRADCGKSFNDASVLKKHKRIHTGEKPYHCKECEMRFNYSASLKRHQLIHTGEKPYLCNKCKMCFNYSGNLKRHQQIHTAEKPHYCTDCRRSFTELRSLKKHKQIHKGEKPYHCNECGKGFFRSDRLFKHCEIHTAVKP